MSKFNYLKETLDLSIYKTFNKSLFHPKQHILLVLKATDKLDQPSETEGKSPTEASAYYIAKLKGSKIKLIKKGSKEEEEFEDEGGSGTGDNFSSDGLDDGDNGGHDEDIYSESADKDNELENDSLEDSGELDHIADQLRERREKDNYGSEEVYEQHQEQINKIKDNLDKIEQHPHDETDHLYLRLAEAMVGSLADINITVIDNNHDAYITGVLEFLDIVTSTTNRRELLAINKDRFPVLCKQAEKTVPDGFETPSGPKPEPPSM